MVHLPPVECLASGRPPLLFSDLLFKDNHLGRAPARPGGPITYDTCGGGEGKWDGFSSGVRKHPKNVSIFFLNPPKKSFRDYSLH